MNTRYVMMWQQRLSAWLGAGLLLATPAILRADCTTLPPIISTNTFLQNFLNPCYALSPHPGNGTGGLAGDADAIYNTPFYDVLPGYQLVIVGYYPNARFFSLTVDDDHQATSTTLNDKDIVPFYPGNVNNFVPGQVFESSQTYVAILTLGGGQPTNPQAGCVLDTTHVNFLDGTLRHTGISWNNDPAAVAQLGPHEEGVPNTGGYVMVRRYLDNPGDVSASNPFVIAQDTTTGCAVPLSVAINKVMSDGPPAGGISWIHNQQVSAHNTYDNSILKSLCWGTDPLTAGQWFRGGDYVPGTNPAAGYIAVNLTSTIVSTLISQNRFFRARFRLPTIPKTPCAGCSLTGNEQLRYLSFSFLAGSVTLGSISDYDLLPDAQGYVTLVVGLGASQPSQVTAANGYTWLDLSGSGNVSALSSITMRYMLPSPSFNCSSFNVPTHTSEYTVAGGYMGEYIPSVDFPDSGAIPTKAYPLVRPNTCSQIPAGPAPQCQP